MILVICPNPSIDHLTWLGPLSPGALHRVRKEKRFPGGKGVHVALALAELGEDVTLLGFWGGPTGEWIINECQKLGIHVLGPRVDGWTRSCFAFQSEGAWQDTEILGRGPLITTEQRQEFFAIYRDQVELAKVITMSGSRPDGIEADFYAECLRLAVGAPCLIDCAGEAFNLALARKPFGLHLNHHEGADFLRQQTPEIQPGRNAIRADQANRFGGKNSRLAIEVIERLRDRTEIIALTVGAEGLYLSHNNQIVHASCPLDQVLSTVGSGDCLLAGLAAAVARSHSLEDMARLAVACGAANCLREDLGLLYRSDVDQLFSKVQIQYLGGEESIKEHQHEAF